MGITIAMGLLAAAIASNESGQTSTQAASPVTETSSAWSVSAGFERLSLRDIARTVVPMDGSPVAREGSGPAIRVNYERAPRRNRLHRFEGGTVVAKRFSYVTPLRQLDLASNHRFVRVDGRYQYFRYPFTDAFVDGLDLGFGVQTDLARRSFSRDIPGAISVQQTRTDVGFAVPLTARLARWDHLDAEATWGVGLVLSRARQLHSAGSGMEDGHSGGGATSGLDLRARIRIARQLRLIASYTSAQDWRFSGQGAYSARRRQFLFGATYDR